MQQPKSERVTSDLLLLTVDAARCKVHTGYIVAPESEIGEDPKSGGVIVAGVNGRVEAVVFSAADHALVVMIRVDDPTAAAQLDRLSITESE